MRKSNSYWETVFIYFLKIFMYLFVIDREAETQAGGEAGFLLAAQCGTWSQDPGITTWAKGRCSVTEPPRCPLFFSLNILFIYSWETQEERGRDTGRGRRSSSMQRAWCRTRSWESEIRPWTKGRRSTVQLLSHPGIPLLPILNWRICFLGVSCVSS